MMRSLLLLTLVTLFILPIVADLNDQPIETPKPKSRVKVLTDSNFEHDTQAATGGTTGDWFVEFYAPWCGHCKVLEPTWEKLAVLTQGRTSSIPSTPVTIAKIDATVETSTARRFDVRGYPTLKYIHNGKYYDYTGPRELAELEKFVSEKQWKDSEGTKVPPPFTMWDEIWDQLYQASEDVKLIVTRKTEASIVVFTGGALTGILLSVLIFIMCLDKPQYRTPTTPVAGPTPTPAAVKKSQ